MAMARAILAVVALAAAAAQLAAAADHPVGGTGAWDASSAGYNAWSATQKFVQGDTLSFKYAASHDVTEVSKAGYDACSGANAVKAYTGGAATVRLAAPGTRYFICSVPGHCAAGMKLEVTVAAAPAPAATSKPAPASEAPAVPATNELPNVSPPTAAPAPKSSDGASIRVVGAKVAMALAVAMAFTFAV
ncbi:hypothetical protein ACP4OV_011928 [Aristida adscensionis]